jgi:predicted DCC family thiol-disulfide oxidoreductase YuxK
MKNDWSGGQYSLYRAIFGGYLFVHFWSLVAWGPELFSSVGLVPNPWASPLARLFPNVLTLWDSPDFVRCLLLVATGSALLLAMGVWDRTAAVSLWYLNACFVGRNPLIANPALPFIGWLLLAHAFLPAAPYGSLAARGRSDPRGQWRMQPGIYAAAWALMSLGYFYSGLMKLNSPSWIDGSALARVLTNPLARPGFFHHIALTLPSGFLRVATWGALALEVSFGPLALIRRARPWIWSGMLLLHLGLFILISFPDLTAGMVILHLFTFNPAWIPAVDTNALEYIFYDGHCGLCHQMVRFMIAEDVDGTKFKFAPLQRSSLESSALSRERAGAPDSIIVRATDGSLLKRSAAFVHILGRLGGTWRILAATIAFLPRPLADAAYDSVARIRYVVFGRRTNICPVISAELRIRFVDDTQ